MLYQIRMEATKHARILQVLIETIKIGTPEERWDYQINQYIGQIDVEREW